MSKITLIGLCFFLTWPKRNSLWQILAGKPPRTMVQFLQPLDSFVSASTVSFVKIFKNFNLEKSFILPLKCLWKFTNFTNKYLSWITDLKGEKTRFHRWDDDFLKLFPRQQTAEPMTAPLLSRQIFVWLSKLKRTGKEFLFWIFSGSLGNLQI